MRLALFKRPPEANRWLVAEVPPPAWNVAKAADDKRRFEETYRRLHGSLLDHAGHFASPDDARDAVANAWVSLLLRWPTLSQEQRSDKYIFGVVTNCIRKQKRAEKRRVSLDDAEPELDRRAASSFADASDRELKAEILDEVLAAMPPRRREVLLLVKEEGISYPAAAEVLGLSLGTVRTHIRLGYDDLRAAFTRAGFQIAGATFKQLSAPKGDATND